MTGSTDMIDGEAAGVVPIGCCLDGPGGLDAQGAWLEVKQSTGHVGPRCTRRRHMAARSTSRTSSVHRSGVVRRGARRQASVGPKS
jgi:hypothetical protein